MAQDEKAAGMDCQDLWTVVVIDDVPMFRELAQLFLSRTGRVVQAERALEGLEKAQSLKPDMVISDLRMPGMDGDELCRIVKNDPQLCETPFLMMVSETDTEGRGRALRAGADDLVAKPLSRVSLVDSVNRFLAYDQVRGLPRVSVSEPVRITEGEQRSWGVMRNLSRGGVFVETDQEIAPRAEVRLHFVLPETTTETEPRAQVVWQRPGDGGSAGVGMRFLEMEPKVARWLEEYVWEHFWIEKTGGLVAGDVA